MSSRRAVLLVLDSVGVGEAPDAAAFGDEGAHTLGHISEAVPGFALPNLQRLGLGNLPNLPKLEPTAMPIASYGRMRERSQGKDTTTGHWEFMGLILHDAFRTFPLGFDESILDPFMKAIGQKQVLGNCAASGTEIIERLGREHVLTGAPIVYTSADPVFQIAAHEDVVPLELLYQWCERAYEIVAPLGISRVIARPFVGEWPHYKRTPNRRDFAVAPPSPTTLDALVGAGVTVTGVGKIADIYANQGITDSIHTKSNADGMATTLRLVQEDRAGLIFTNLVDFDALYGHRRNPEGYASALVAFDAWLPTLLDALGEEDLLIITADHGNDPTFKGTDHTREYVPVIALRGGKTRAELPGHDLGTRDSFADVGATLADFFGVSAAGTSFLAQV